MNTSTGTGSIKRGQPEVSKMYTACADLQAASFKCLEAHEGHGANCKVHFDAYKACKKDEREKQIEERRKQLV